MEWTNEKIIELIKMYRALPVLWDSQHKSYKDSNMRHEALKHVASNFGVDKEEIERKIKNLRSHYSRELKKLSRNSRYKCKWFCYKSMEFLRAKPRKKKYVYSKVPRSYKKSVIKTETTNFDENGTENDTQLPTAALKRKRKLEVKIARTNSNEYEGNQTMVATPTRFKKKLAVALYKQPLKGLKSTTSPVPSAEESAESAEERILERDEYTIFGEQIAIKLRKLPTTHARCVVQHIINTTIFEAEMGKYNNPAGVHYPVSAYLKPFSQ